MFIFIEFGITSFTLINCSCYFVDVCKYLVLDTCNVVTNGHKLRSMRLDIPAIPMALSMRVHLDMLACKTCT